MNENQGRPERQLRDSYAMFGVCLCGMVVSLIICLLF
jgi:hypothetical protein